MTYWLIPSGLLTKVLINKGPLISQSAPFFFMCVFFGYIILFKKNIFDLRINLKVVYVAIIILISQIIAIILSILRYPDSMNQTSGILNGTVSVVFTGFIIFATYYVLLTTLSNPRQVKKFFIGSLLIFAVYLIVILLPQAIDTVTGSFDKYANLIGHLEQRHVGRNDFYAAGSYVTTLRRVNGLLPEASFLAAMISIVFVPMMVSGIVNHYDLFGLKKKSIYLLWGMLLITIGILFMAKTSTGFIAIALAVLELFAFSNKFDKKIYFCLGIASLLVIIVMYFQIDFVHTMLNNYLLKKQGISNRLGGTIGLLLTFIHNPIIGVGMGFTSPYVFDYVPFSMTINEEFIKVFSSTGFADQSVWGEIFAYFGLVLVIPLGLFIKNKIKMSIAILKSNSNNLSRYVIHAFLMYLINITVISLFSFEWNQCIYYTIFFAYIVSINLFSGKGSEYGE